MQIFPLRADAMNLSEIRDEALATELRARGWRCEKDSGEGWEKPSEFARRHGIASGSFCRMLARNSIPGREFDRAPGGRLRYVRGSQETENWWACRWQQQVNKKQQPDNSSIISGEKSNKRLITGASAFDRFWALYPKHVGKVDAKKAWVTMECEALIERILAGVARCRASEPWTKEHGRFIPHPATWLRRGGWEDDLEPLHRHGTLAQADMPKVVKFG